jgi:hypothetical protein
MGECVGVWKEGGEGWKEEREKKKEDKKEGERHNIDLHMYTLFILSFIHPAYQHY